MKKVFLFLLCIAQYCFNASTQPTDNFVIKNELRPLYDGECLVLSERIIRQDDNYGFTISIKNDNKTKNVLELKNISTAVLYNDKKKILIQVGNNENAVPYRGDPIYLINGLIGSIEFLDYFVPGFFLVESENVIIDRLYRDSHNYLIDDIYVYDIQKKELVFICDVNKYLRTKLLHEDSHYDLDFPDYINGHNRIIDDHIRVYFNQWGENGPNSFFAFLNIKNKRNVYIDDQMD